MNNDQHKLQISPLPHPSFLQEYAARRLMFETEEALQAFVLHFIWCAQNMFSLQEEDVETEHQVQMWISKPDNGNLKGEAFLMTACGWGGVYYLSFNDCADTSFLTNYLIHAIVYATVGLMMQHGVNTHLIDYVPDDQRRLVKNAKEALERWNLKEGVLTLPHPSTPPPIY